MDRINVMDRLTEIRKNIEACDDQIIEALTKRMKCIEEIIDYKREHHMPIFQPDQEAKQQQKLDKKFAGLPYKAEMEDVFRNITANSKKLQARVLFPKNIILVGFMGAGKTSLASYLAQQLSMKTIETDEEIVRREGMSISEIFDLYGESYFRDRESEVIRDVKEGHQMVISVGGGSVIRDENVANMKASGIIILLTATPSTILNRVKDSTERPLLNGHMNESYIGKLMDRRKSRYEEVADYMIDTNGKTVPEVCEAIISALYAGEV